MANKLAPGIHDPWEYDDLPSDLEGKFCDYTLETYTEEEEMFSVFVLDPAEGDNATGYYPLIRVPIPVSQILSSKLETELGPVQCLYLLHEGIQECDLETDETHFFEYHGILINVQMGSPPRIIGIDASGYRKLH